MAQGLDNLINQICEAIEQAPSVKAKVELLNKVRRRLHEVSPFSGEPVDFVEWVPADNVIANDYNPNKVASTEMDLLHMSIKEDGFTQPIVAFNDSEYQLVVDGFHRNLVGKTRKDIRERIHGYLPITHIEKSLQNRMASTVRHNRARGKHQVGSMADLVIALSQKGWSDSKIAKHMGMEAEEVLRLKQEVGVADYYKSREFSRSWEWIPSAEDNIDEELKDLEEKDTNGNVE